MIKNSRYIMISVFFIFVFVLFLAFNPDSYQIKPEPLEELIREKNYVSPPLGENGISRDEIAVVTDDMDTEVKKNVLLTLSLLQHNYKVCDSIDKTGFVNTIIIATPIINNNDVEALKLFLENGGSVIFTILPDNLTEELMDLLGIVSYIPDYEVVGFDLYEGILLGGMFRVEELSLQCLKITLSGTCKVFANGHDSDRDKTALVIKREDENPLIWRTYHESGKLFVINASFMTDMSGMGVLTGVLSLAAGDFIYPVIGTKNIILDYFPYIGNEGDSIGGRTYHTFIRDIIWPDLVSISRNLNITFTCYTNGNFAKNKESRDIIQFLNNELYKTMKGEIGYSIKDELDFSVLENDMMFVREHFTPYALRSFKFQPSEDIKELTNLTDQTSILTSDWSSAFQWVNDQTVRLPIISSGFKSEYINFVFISAASTLGLVMHQIDMKPVFTGEAAWNYYSMEMSKYFDYLLQKFTFLKAAPVKSTAELVKDYLNLNMSIDSDEQSMNVSISGNTGEISFLLRTNKRIDIKKCINCSVMEIEDGAYLVKSSGTEFVIWFDI